MMENCNIPVTTGHENELLAEYWCPSVQSQRSRILEHLQAGKPLTALEALNWFGCMNLKGRICDLRQAGYVIDTEMIKIASHKRVAKYTLISQPKNN